MNGPYIKYLFRPRKLSRTLVLLSMPRNRNYEQDMPKKEENQSKKHLLKNRNKILTKYAKFLKKKGDQIRKFYYHAKKRQRFNNASRADIAILRDQRKR